MPVKILMVCLGNICRSPLAEGILASKLPNDKFIIDSAGTGSWHIGHAPDERSITTAKKMGLDIANQKGKQFTNSDFDTFDYIFVMDTNNYNDVISLTQNEEHKNKVQLILKERFPNDTVGVPDPYYGSASDFDKVYHLLDEACTAIAERLKKSINK